MKDDNWNGSEHRGWMKAFLDYIVPVLQDLGIDSEAIQRRVRDAAR